MKNAKQLKFFTTFVVIVFCAIMSTAIICGTFVTASASTSENIYYDIYAGDTYEGNGYRVADDYNVYYDDVEITYIEPYNAPSFTGNDAIYSNYCAPLAGLNIVGFYDRWHTNLIPNYDPGVTLADGRYVYYPDLGKSEVRTAFGEIYSLMKTGEVGGTTSANFKSGLNTYVKNSGYKLSSSSMYKSSTTVDLDKLTTAVNQGKVGVVMCSEYNYISSITNVKSESRVQVIKTNSNIAHMMMVYGYRVYKYYKNGVNFQTDTFLCVGSSYGSGDLGYMQLNNFSVIDEALIMTVS